MPQSVEARFSRLCDTCRRLCLRPPKKKPKAPKAKPRTVDIHSRTPPPVSLWTVPTPTGAMHSSRAVSAPRAVSPRTFLTPGDRTIAHYGDIAGLR